MAVCVRQEQAQLGYLWDKSLKIGNFDKFHSLEWSVGRRRTNLS